MSRIHALDAARASLLLLGVLFHAAVFVYLYQKPASVSEFLFVAYTNQVLHVFRMPAFFLISGFFAAYLVSSRGAGSYLANRLGRIALPLIIFWLPVTFANNWTSQGAWITGRSTFEILPVDFQHLWFLYFLIFFSLVLVLLTRLVKLEKLPNIHPAVAMVLMALLMPLLPSVLNDQGELGTSTVLFPEPGLLAWYFWVFLAGAIAFHQKDSWLGFLRNRAVLLSTLFLLAFTLFFFSQDTGWELVGVTYGVAAALGSFGVIGLFLRFADRPSKIMRFLSDASYWLYLVHLPLVFFFLFSLGINGFGAIATILLTSVLTIVVGLVTYKVFVRHTFISTLLNGKRHPLKS